VTKSLRSINWKGGDGRMDSVLYLGKKKEAYPLASEGKIWGVGNRKKGWTVAEETQSP
jgi:hypothetical protein